MKFKHGDIIKYIGFTSDSFETNKEYEVYKNAGADTEFVGHPLVDIVKPHLSKEAAWKKAGKNADRDLILLLPGSRLMEIQKMPRSRAPVSDCSTRVLQRRERLSIAPRRPRRMSSRRGS